MALGSKNMFCWTDSKISSTYYEPVGTVNEAQSNFVDLISELKSILEFLTSMESKSVLFFKITVILFMYKDGFVLFFNYKYNFQACYFLYNGPSFYQNL